MGSRLEKNSSQVRKRIENHTFTDEGGEEYEPSAFGGFGDYFRRKKIKLQNLDSEIRASSSSEKPQIFKGIVAHVMGYTQPSLHVLHRELVQHGAGFLQYLDSKTMATHIIASTLPPKKTVDYSRYRIVKPAWVTDSIQAGKLLPWSDYRVIDEGPRQKVLKFDGGKMSQANPQQRMGYREQTDNSIYTAAFRNTAEAGSTQSLSQFAEKLDSPGPGGSSSKPSTTNDDAGTLQPASLDEVAEDDVYDDMDINDAMDQGLLDHHTVENEQSPKSETSYQDQQVGVKQCDKMPENMTSEEHNAWLLSDPRIRKSSTANPEFLKQFYSESRLHHLATWKAELKSKMQRLAKEKGSAAKGWKRKPGSRRYIMHVDFDSFFCSVSLKQQPEFIDRPAVVAHGSGTGSEIASCNYAARKFGVKNGMWMKRALDMCPDIKVLPYDFPAYEEASRLFYESILEVGGVVQSVSVDEALVDVTVIVLSAARSDGSGVDEGSIWREQETAEELATTLRQKIKLKTGCAVSVGIGGNILLAKVALRKAKPAGQFQVRPEDILDLLGDLEAKDLPGVAHSLGGKLEEIGVKFVKDIRQLSKERLSSVLGPKTGEKLWEYARGIDRTEVGEQPPRKSVSAEVNWGIRFINQQEAEEFVMNLCKELERRLLNEQVKGKHLTVKIMRRSLDAPLDPAKHLGHGRCDTFNKSMVFGVATHDGEIIGKEAVSILRSFKFSPGDLRGFGMQLTKLDPIKSGAAGVDGSQRRLAFPTFNGPPSAKKTKTDPIEDLESPQKPSASPGHDVPRDPIADDPLTPRKPKSASIHPALALARAGEIDAMARTPLNVTGTQFIMPTNPDPAVLAELPNDIRAKLLGRNKNLAFARQESPTVKSRSQSPALVDEMPSQIDPEVFHALPDDMKAEVLASYGRKGGQALLPQSPRKDRLVQQKKATTPTKRGIRGMWSKARERQHDAASNLMQTNFLPIKGGEDVAEEEGPEELDSGFLAELPEDVRREVIEDHRRRRLAHRAGLNFNAQSRRHQGPDAEDILAGGQTKIQFPAPPPKITFTGSSLKSFQEIKEMLDAWYAETVQDGPHPSDVQAFEKYLSRVVLEEKDMHKASKLVQWLGFMVEQDASEGKVHQRWRRALHGIKDEVQKAVGQRGLGPLNI